MNSPSPATPAPASPAAALFTHTQRRLLGLLFGQPQRSFYASELIGLTGAGSGAVQRELKRLTEAGLLTVTTVGRQKHYQADAACPVYPELTGLIRKTLTPSEPIRQGLATLADGIEQALLLEPATADAERLRVLVVGDVTPPQLAAALAPAEAALGRRIEVALYSGPEFRQRRFAASPVLMRLLASVRERLL